MATRCLIAEPTATGWQGRYCHWDGYPDSKVGDLLALVLRDGLEKVRQTIIHDNYSWSSIDLNAAALPDIQQDGRFKLVEGYGIAHLDVPADDPIFTQDDKEFGWAEYLYILADDGLESYSIGSAPIFLDKHSWATELV